MAISIGDAVAVIGFIRDHLKYDEIDALVVDAGWLDLAKEKGIIPASRDYVWSALDKVPTRELAGTHEIVWVIDKEQRTKRRVERRDGVTLTARSEGH